MYQFDDENLNNLNEAFNFLNMIEVKGLQNNNNLLSVASSLQKFYSGLRQQDESIVIDNTPEGKKEAKEK